jgi:hypothetical protein
MEMTETVLLAFLTAKLKGYRLKPFFLHWEVYPMLFFILMYIPLQVMMFQEKYYVLKLSDIYKPLLLISFIPLILKLKLYKSGLAGAVFITAGTILNNIVMAANGGKMPIFATFSLITGYIKPTSFDKLMVYDKIHVLGSASSRLAFMSDVIDLGYSILSIGDILTRMYGFVIIYSAIKVLHSYAVRTADKTDAL